MITATPYRTVSPEGAPSIEIFHPANRPATLAGRRIAFVWDYLFRGDEIFALLEEALGEACPGATFVSYEKFGNTLGGNDRKVLAELPGKLAEHGVDVVISGIGCCGACTPAVVRASAAIEKAGIPTASLVCEGFAGQARAVSPGLGCAWLPVVEMPGYVDSLSNAELRDMVLSHTANAVAKCLTTQPAPQGKAATIYSPTEIVATGDFNEINEIYRVEGWSDGLPIVPPTRDAVAEFLKFTPYPPDRLIGCVQPSGSGVTIWNVAVNGVMAGCAPEYMPVLVAIAEIMANPAYGVEHSGDTTGGDPLIVLSGPVIEVLGFNCENGAMREGTRANTTVGRFLRLFLRNVVGLRPGEGDKCTFGHSARVVLAEHEPEVAKLGWTTFAGRKGFAKGSSVVTVGRFTGDTVVGSIYGRDPEDIAIYLADGLIRQSCWELCFTAGLAPGTLRPLVAISPMVAKTLAKAGSNIEDLRERLYRHARIPAWKFEAYIGKYSNCVPGRRTLRRLHEDGLAAAHFAESDDPNRLVPIVERADHILIVVSGDPYRSNAMVFGSNGLHGFPTSREIRLA
ncbi:hypothetical protein SAMN03159423_0019 [Bradyrhizobium sp. NFR13]|uniref:UGSC family (seleno)protein n=1 Tax=Bradyrhizobium sp. NFR13 TaxID=1566285 RepID=UPI0008E9C803|nr:hypothetical protein [Bradyrhizobium sp. NFR13]SFM21584.1 hypothetical protein SAMN03159423_0019 [Bradyrhizobium sp. NFR13]